MQVLVLVGWGIKVDRVSWLCMGSAGGCRRSRKSTGKSPVKCLLCTVDGEEVSPRQYHWSERWRGRQKRVCSKVAGPGVRVSWGRKRAGGNDVACATRRQAMHCNTILSFEYLVHITSVSGDLYWASFSFKINLFSRVEKARLDDSYYLASLSHCSLPCRLLCPCRHYITFGAF